MRKRNQLFNSKHLSISTGFDLHGAGGDPDEPDRGDLLPDDAAAAAAQAAADAADAAEAAKAEAAKADDVAIGKTLDEGADETEEEKVEREAEELRHAEEAKQAARKRIPLNRHEEILSKQRADAAAKEQALGRRITELETAGKQPARVDPLAELVKALKAKEDEYEELLFAGDKAEAKLLRVEIGDLRDRHSDAKAAASSAATRNATINELKYEQALARIETDYPSLNPDGDTYDEAQADEVAELLTLFADRGLTRQAALAKAVGYVMGQPAAKKDDVSETLRVKREQEARAKAAAAGKQQPPDGKKVGADNVDTTGDVTGATIMKMSQEKFAKLDEDTLSKLRGDVL